MTLTKGTRSEIPRLWGLAEIMPLSIDQYDRMIETGIIRAEDPIAWVDGYLVSKDQGTGYAWPYGMLPSNVPCVDGGAPIWPLSLEQYHRMLQSGILPEESSYELLEGYLVTKEQGKGPGMGHGQAHALGVAQTFDQLRAALDRTWSVRCQLPITLNPNQSTGVGQEPEPDASIAPGPQRRYRDHHPGPQELQLVVEVADSSLPMDRNKKGPLYASAGIPLYWIVNLVDRQLEVYSDPDPATGQYRSQQMLAEDQQVVLSWPGLAPVTFAVKDFLP